jgi:Ca2+-binding EF-hand superfamily protein
MSFADFCDIFNECMQNKDQHDELLQSAFAVFDFEKYFYNSTLRSGYIDSKKIKKVFEKFKDNTTEEEIQSNKYHAH